MNESPNPIHAPVAKAVSANVAAFFALNSWSDVAAVLAALYSVLLIVEWVWKRVARPYAERRGWVKPKPRRNLLTRATDLGDLDDY